MLKAIFTLDYEIHGNGEGSPLDLMIKPTDRLLRFLDGHGAKLTIMADVAEILKFREYRDQNGRDEYYYEAIAEQLQRAVRTGHDVQLHIHPSYFNARHEKGLWLQDWSEYDLAGLPYERIELMIRTGKEFLEAILKPADSAYECVAFRAGNWSVNPSKQIVRALVKNNIRIDTSLFKHGRRQGIVNFDYSSAHHHFLPWPADPDDVCRYDAGSQIWEFPIYSDNRWLTEFITLNRIYGAVSSSPHRVSNEPRTLGRLQPAVAGRKPLLSYASRKYPWKADFNKCSGRQLIRALSRANEEVKDRDDKPFILIGHSKLFNWWNERTLLPFVTFIKEHNSWTGFGTLRQFGKLSGRPITPVRESPPRYVIISPVRDEEEFIRYTLDSVIKQTVRPVEWVIVNDGSTDRTGEIIDKYSKDHPWIKAIHRENRGYRKAGGGVVDAFYEGYAALSTDNWEFIVKLDGDLSFQEEYFEKCLEKFRTDLNLGVGGGDVYNLIEGRLELEKQPRFHVRGATKIYKRDCWDALGALLAAPGWDTLDEVKANMLGWTTYSFPDLGITHHRVTGGADGSWRNAVKGGLANYICGYHPLFMASKCFKRLAKRPYLLESLGYMYGFGRALLKGVPKVDDPLLIRYLRRQQLKRLFLKPTIWI